MIELHVSVTTVVNRWVVHELGGKTVSWEGTQRMDPKKLPAGKRADRFACLNPEGPARVKVGLEEKLSGPTGTYSSISVRIEISARCDQNERALGEAQSVLYEEGLKSLDHYINPALSMLIEHTEKQGRA